MFVQSLRTPSLKVSLSNRPSAAWYYLTQWLAIVNAMADGVWCLGKNQNQPNLVNVYSCGETFFDGSIAE